VKLFASRAPRIRREVVAAYRVAMTGHERHPHDVRGLMDPTAAAGAQNGSVHQFLRRPPWPDVALCAVLAVAMVLFDVYEPDVMQDVSGDVPRPPLTPAGARSVALHPDEPAWPARLLAAVLITVPLLARRRWPLVAFAVQYPVVLAAEAASNLPALVAVLIGAYSVAAYLPATVSMGVLVGTASITAAIEGETWPRIPGSAGVFVILLSIGLFGVAIRSARGRAEASQQRALALEREQDAATRLALVQERARIARELHDVVSHHVSVMTIQAGAAGKVLDSRPDLARGALAAIETSGRETMAELRHLLGALAPEPVGDPLRPQPGLDQLDALVENVRQAGQPVTVRRTPVDLPRGMDLAAYRVVQEALTNALRHAPGAHTYIDITVEDPELVIEVTNDAPAGPPRPANGSGSGLIGLAERLRLYDGELETGRRPGGGFRVRARMPWGAS
jgi:signal transduction histidine kinase